MALTGIDITDLTTSNPFDIAGEVIDTTFTTEETTAGPCLLANNTGSGLGAGVYRLDDDFDGNAFTYRQTFRNNSTHPDNRFADGTVQVIWTNLGDDEQATTTCVNNTNNLVISPSGTADGESFKYGFSVVGMEEGTNLNISYTLRCSPNADTGPINFTVTVPEITGLHGCPFQSVEKYQRLNQRLNGRSSTTYEFSSFRKMYKDIAKKK